MNEFVPKIDDATIERLVQRDFVEEITDRVRALLESYGPKPHHFDRNRVRAAVLKLANGDPAELPRQLAIADMDFRDVVGAAEYPSQMKIGFVGLERLAAARLQELREQDWREYSIWLSRT